MMCNEQHRAGLHDTTVDSQQSAPISSSAVPKVTADNGLVKRPLFSATPVSSEIGVTYPFLDSRASFQSNVETQLIKPVATDIHNRLAVSDVRAGETSNFHTLASQTSILGQACEQRVEDLVASAEPPSKKQKLQGDSFEQRFDQMNDVLIASSVNLREEVKKMLPQQFLSSGFRRQEKDDRLFLDKKPLHDKVVTIAKNCGIPLVNEDVELCLSLSVEEWLQSILFKVIRFSNEDFGKGTQKVLVTSDVGAQIRMLRRKAKEALEAKGMVEKKQTTDKEKITEGQAEPQVNPQKGRKAKVKVPDVRASQIGEMMLKWQIMAEQGRLKRAAGAQGQKQDKGATQWLDAPKKSKTPNILAADSRRPPGSSSSASKAGQQEKARSINVNDLVSVLQTDTRTAKSSLLYLFHNRVSLGINS